jgi:transcriptional regulator with XRE-family HTH domain
MTLGTRLKDTRLSRGMTITQAADELGVARTAYRLWELGAASPSPEHWKRIAFWCGLPIVSIMLELGLIGPEDEEPLLELSALRIEQAAATPKESASE